MKSVQQPLLWAALPLLMTGCASQANLVDMDGRLKSIEERVSRAAALGGAPAGTPAGAAGASAASAASSGSPAGPGMLDITLAVDQLRQEMAELRGQVEELGHGVDSLAHSTDGRLAVLEQRGGASPIPGRPASAGPEGGGMSPSSAVDTPIRLPGSVVGSRGATPDQAFGLARRDYDKGNYNIAAAGFANFLQQFPDSPRLGEATYWLGASYRAQGQGSRARQVWEAQLKNFPRDPASAKALLGLGEMFRGEDNVPGAEDALKRLIARFPDSEEARRAKSILSELR
ncbi:MAG: tetratricopeptide repeat protein [Nitrospirota bacterium]|nr:tetratricopeptide repeat protein [Nitrospirota bacterium]